MPARVIQRQRQRHSERESVCRTLRVIVGFDDTLADDAVELDEVEVERCFDSVTALGVTFAGGLRVAPFEEQEARQTTPTAEAFLVGNPLTITFPTCDTKNQKKTPPKQNQSVNELS